MNQIERLIKDGYLKRYVADRSRQEFSRQGGRGRGRTQESQPRARVVDTGEEIWGTMTTIAGGFVGGGETSAARRRYSRSAVQEVMTIEEQGLEYPHLPSVTFSDDDFKGITPHEHDPMRSMGEYGGTTRKSFLCRIGSKRRFER
ncbi:hypothetical protein SESBI_46298 [Sesbania bispinosa]|nr:hypothetical protein SESBI_46298 [Sesbania bispinosa]